MIDNILNQLDKVKSTGNGKYKSLCPAHNDSNPSLAISEVDDKILLKCWSGCTTQEILNATGLTWNDLFLNDLTNEQKKHQQQKQEIKQFKKDLTILQIASKTRDIGEKLTHKDLELEREAWERVNG